MRHDGREVEYGSAEDLLSRIRVIERASLSGSSGTPAAAHSCGFASFSRT